MLSGDVVRTSSIVKTGNSQYTLHMRGFRGKNVYLLSKKRIMQQIFICMHYGPIHIINNNI